MFQVQILIPVYFNAIFWVFSSNMNLIIWCLNNHCSCIAVVLMSIVLSVSVVVAAWSRLVTGGGGNFSRTTSSPSASITRDSRSTLTKWDCYLQWVVLVPPLTLLLCAWVWVCGWDRCLCLWLPCSIQEICFVDYFITAANLQISGKCFLITRKDHRIFLHILSPFYRLQNSE